MIVIAKTPVPGRVKTRLQSRFSPAEASALAQAALTDTLTTVGALPVARRLISLDGDPGPWIPDCFEVMGQGGGSLDLRLENAFARAFAPAVRGPGPVVLIGMDTPQVTAGRLATDWSQADAVLGLAEDGGFWAIGFRDHAPGAIAGVQMSTAHTGADQLARLRLLGLRVQLLPELRDVDTPEDAAAVAALAPTTGFAALYRTLVHGRASFPPAAREHPLDLYAAALDGAPLIAELPGGQRLPIDVERWTGSPGPADRILLNRCEGPVLDLGCGPGRLVGALAASGRPALGVDICRTAVEHTAQRGASVLLRSVHERLPGEGRWGTVLLADGNIGITGDPDGLLRRCTELLAPLGLLLAEADANEEIDSREHIRLVSGGRHSWPMPWARLGRAALAAAAQRTGFDVAEEWRSEGRVFMALRSPAAPHLRSATGEAAPPAAPETGQG